MKNRARIFLTIFCILFGGITLWSGYFIITPYVIGPRLEVQLACSSIQPGTTAPELENRFGRFAPLSDTQNALSEAIMSELNTSGAAIPQSTEELNRLILKIYNDLDYYSYLDLGYDPSLEPYLTELLAQNNGRLPEELLSNIARRLGELEGTTDEISKVEDGPVLVHSNFKSGWLCTCEVEMEGGKVDHSNVVICTDQ